MVLEASESLQGNEYQVRMLLANDIPGCLKARMRMIDNKIEFFYDITSKQPVGRIYEKKRMGSGDIRAPVSYTHLIIVEKLRKRLMERLELLGDLEDEQIRAEIDDVICREGQERYLSLKQRQTFGQELFNSCLLYTSRCV